MEKNKNNPKEGQVWSYRGVKIEYSCGYFYPVVNGNIESKKIRDIKRYINRCYIPAMEGIANLFRSPLTII